MTDFDPTCPACFMRRHEGHPLRLLETGAASCSFCNEDFTEPTKPMRLAIEGRRECQKCGTRWSADGPEDCPSCLDAKAEADPDAL